MVLTISLLSIVFIGSIIMNLVLYKFSKLNGEALDLLEESLAERVKDLNQKARLALAERFLIVSYIYICNNHESLDKIKQIGVMYEQLKHNIDCEIDKLKSPSDTLELVTAENIDEYKITKSISELIDKQFVNTLMEGVADNVKREVTDLLLLRI